MFGDNRAVKYNDRVMGSSGEAEPTESKIYEAICDHLDRLNASLQGLHERVSVRLARCDGMDKAAEIYRQQRDMRVGSQ